MSDSPVAATLRQALSCGRPGCACGRSVNTHCPTHEDKAPSLTVHAAADGKLLVHCKRGCPQRNVVAALKQRDLWPERNGHTPIPPHKPTPIHSPARPTALYDYRDATGTLIAQKCRIDRPDGSKTFRWRRPGAEGWPGLAGLSLSEVPLYGAELVAMAAPDALVLYVEGEKAAEAARGAGLLAVTHGGGAATQDFGQSLQVLAGHPVLLWPDNDAAGRTYMARVHATLRPIAASVVTLNPPVPEKGDAYDYFAARGTVTDLLADAPPSEPVVDLLAHDAIRVRIPTPLGTASFAFTAIERGGKSLEAELEVCLLGPGMPTEPYAQRLNVLSASARTELRRDLESIFGGDKKLWTGLLNTVLARLRHAYDEFDPSQLLSEITDPGDQRFLLHPLLPEGKPTIFFGDGGSAKTYLLLYFGLLTALGGEFAGERAVQGPVLFVDYEDDEKTFRFRLGRLLAGLGMDLEDIPDLPYRYWPARGVPLSEQVPALRRRIERDGTLLVIVDSAAPACGAEPETSSGALRFFQQGIHRLGNVTTATSAHITKLGDTDKPFGSGFWHHEARRTWFVKRDNDEDTDNLAVGLYCRKSNDGRKQAPLGLTIQFEGTNGPVTIRPLDPAHNPVLFDALSLPRRIRECLREQSQLWTREIVAATGESEPTIRRTLARMPEVVCLVPGKGRGNQSLWGLRDDQHQEHSSRKRREIPYAD